MVPLIVLASAFGVTLIVTAVRSPRRRPDAVTSLRVAVAAMFTVTGISHFVGMRGNMIAMVPSGLPLPEVIVTVTGLLELAAAVAMAFTRWVPWAAVGLTVMLVAMFPANVNLALSGTDLAWTQTLVPRAVLQLIYVAATVSLAILGWRSSRDSHSVFTANN